MSNSDDPVVESGKKTVWFSIITVCLNAEKVIEGTIQSVQNQDYQDYEYILIDGCSADKTVETIKKYAEKDKRIRLISERDKGLYDAMNKGVLMAKGKYLHFLNAGDCYADRTVLDKVRAFIDTCQTQKEDKKPDIYYGDIVYRYPDGTEKQRRYPAYCGRPFYYATGDCINHQAVFVNRDCFQKNLFDTNYQYCADRDWMMKMHKAGKKYRAMEITVCRYSLCPESVSVKHEKEVWQEAAECIKKNYSGFYPLYGFIDRIRHGKLSGRLLHGIYCLLYIRKQI